jgi:hypothetical protein
MQSVALQDLLQSAREDQQDQAQRIFERVFDSLMWTRVAEGKVEDTSPLKQWTHRQPVEVESDLAYLEINRSEILLALSEYLENPDLASKKADWLFLNVLTYAEYVSTVSEIRKKLMGIERYVKSLFPPKKEHLTDISAFAHRPWHIPVFIAVVVTGWAIHPFAGVLVTGYGMFSSYRQRKARAQVNAIMASMLQTYLSFNTTDLSWRQVTTRLEQSRASGAIWDGSLFALAEQRSGAPNATKLAGLPNE